MPSSRSSNSRSDSPVRLVTPVSSDTESSGFDSDDSELFDLFDFTQTHDLDESSRDDEVSETGFDEEDGGFHIDIGNGKKQWVDFQLLRVFSTSYTGDAELPGSHKVALKSIHGPTSRKKPLFKWLYVNPVINHVFAHGVN